MMHEHHQPEMLKKAAKVAAVMRARRGMSSEDMHKDDRKEAGQEMPIRLNKALGKNK